MRRSKTCRTRYVEDPRLVERVQQVLFVPIEPISANAGDLQLRNHAADVVPIPVARVLSRPIRLANRCRRAFGVDTEAVCDGIGPSIVTIVEGAGVAIPQSLLNRADDDDMHL